MLEVTWHPSRGLIQGSLAMLHQDQGCQLQRARTALRDEGGQTCYLGIPFVPPAIFSRTTGRDPQSPGKYLMSVESNVQVCNKSKAICMKKSWTIFFIWRHLELFVNQSYSMDNHFLTVLPMIIEMLTKHCLQSSNQWSTPRKHRQNQKAIFVIWKYRVTGW